MLGDLVHHTSAEERIFFNTNNYLHSYKSETLTTAGKEMVEKLYSKILTDCKETPDCILVFDTFVKLGLEPTLHTSKDGLYAITTKDYSLDVLTEDDWATTMFKAVRKILNTYTSKY